MAETTDGGITAALMAILASNGGFNNRNGRDFDNGFDGYRTEQNQANMALMASVGAVDKSVAVSGAALEASQAVQTLAITQQAANLAAGLSNTTQGVKETVNTTALMLANKLSEVDRSVMESRYEVSKDITADGDKTRMLITSNYQDTLNRQLTEANAALVELRSEDRANRRSYDNSLNVTQTVSQAQSQAQTQGQFDRLYHMLAGVTQNIRDTNTAINFGAGTLTNTNTPTNTNNSVGGLV